jgi:hypothetical protein
VLALEAGTMATTRMLQATMASSAMELALWRA